MTNNDENKKKFKVRIYAYGTYEVQIAEMNPEEESTDNLEEKIYDWGDYILSFGMSDNFTEDDGCEFEMTVYDPDGTVVYNTDCYTDLNFAATGDDVISEIEDEGEEPTPAHRALAEQMSKLQEKDGHPKKGSYAVQLDYASGRNICFTVEDTEFDPKKLWFLANEYAEKFVEAFNIDYMTDQRHIFYGNENITKITEAEDEDECECYNTNEIGAALVRI